MEKYIYPASIRNHGCGKAFILRDEEGKEWFVSCGMPRPLDHATADYLRREFPWCAPSRVMGLKKTIAAEDFLGAAGDGLADSFRDTDAVPVLVRHSPLEVVCTGKSYADRLDEAAFAVYREGYMQPWGAEAVVSSEVEAALALLSGFTLITLDLREAPLTAEVPDGAQVEFYLEHDHKVAGETVKFDAEALRQCYQRYGAAIELAAAVYQRQILGKGADYALSVSGAHLPVSALEHYYIASELRRRGVVIQALSLRHSGEYPLCGEYRGNAEQLGQEIRQHAAIAKGFGYKLGFFNCAGKLRILPQLRLETGGFFHTDLDGFSWLSALRLAARRDPSLFRRCYRLALDCLPEAAQLFPLSADFSGLPPEGELTDAQLPGLLDREAGKQLLYAAHGHILHDPMKDELLRLCREQEPEYRALLRAAVRRELDYLNFG